MSWPIWTSEQEQVLLREVAPGLFVGGWQAVRTHPGRRWAAVVDYFGSSGDVSEARHYVMETHVPVLLRWTFFDGEPFPAGMLDATEQVVRNQLPSGPVLLHCHQGLSRSASAAYAMLRVLGGISQTEARRRVFVEAPFPLERTLASADRWVKSRRGAKRLAVLR